MKRFYASMLRFVGWGEYFKAFSLFIEHSGEVEIFIAWKMVDFLRFFDMLLISIFRGECSSGNIGLTI